MALPTHLPEGYFEKLFPDFVDKFPDVINQQHYIDAWLLNTAFNSILAMEAYLIEHRLNIEAPAGDNITGIDGALVISIPSAGYPPGKTATAQDSNLLVGNIKAGVTIFGVTGTYGG